MICFTRVFFFLRVILEPLVADVADVTLDLPFTARGLLRHDVVPDPAVQVVDDVVKLHLVQGYLGGFAGLTNILKTRIYYHLSSECLFFQGILTEGEGSTVDLISDLACFA